MGGDRVKRKSPSAVDKLFDLLFVSIVFAQIECEIIYFLLVVLA